ncbi:molybdopterin oxidoreductase family protein [Hydrogenimonas cancrithermarum]|uniref:Formate dehydrogenase subunit alpha n=1 Tax=Hydrogenimonas cancrithermarum TaxID=2993563 RepID=A0ABM8FKB9_9BACT|nr:molybdopterin-dependent oxidoreductase [Hydrogenimonas cancrithermarum]BDY12759.1 formate dehydrogenase subunit alpha [Hydrogenimonas cancrithermarum]
MHYTEIESVCTYCGVGCDIVAQVDDNKIQKITADKDGYVSQGKLCIKGKYGFDFLDADARLREPRIARRFLEKNPLIRNEIEGALKPLDDDWYTTDLQSAVKAAAMKLSEIRKSYGDESFCAIGGARTSCESAYLFQKFTRDAMNSPHVDNCARVCHSPSLKGMRATIGEGAATNPYNDIYETEFILIIGSNTTEAHPIVANRIIDAARLHDNVAVIDVREIKMMKYAKHKAVIPHEANLLVLNMMAYVILKDELYNKKFVESRTTGFEAYRQKILNDPYADPEFFRKIPGYEHLATLIPIIAREYALKKSMIFWGLGITEHLDGSYAVMAITHLALLTGNIGKTGAGLMPLRGQNNVQGACDMGCLPYYDPDYQTPKKVGLMTPQLVDAMLEGKIKALLNMGEDIAHIHPNQNKIDKALNELEFIMVQELFMTEIAKRADIVIGVKSAYEKEGVYVNAMRRLHLSQPLIESDLPDDWEVIKMLDNAMGGNYDYETSEDVWNEVREVAHRRFSGASYLRLKRHRKRGLQWPVYIEDTPVLHLLDFRTEDGLGRFIYHSYKLRGMVEELLNEGVEEGYYLTTGRTLAHYNNAAQTIRSEKLNNRYAEDILLASEEDEARFPKSEYVVLKSAYGQSAPLCVKFSDKIRPNTLFTTFHHAKSHINYLFGDASDELILTAAFKSIKVEVLPA